jgi:hypothetical protein
VEKKSARLWRWLVLIGYLSLFLLLTWHNIHMYRFNRFLITIIIATILLVAGLWFLRDEEGERLSVRD